MNKYLVSVRKEVCADFEVEAETAKLAEIKALETNFLTDLWMISEDWCDEHAGSRKAVVVEELDDEE
jgi:hypothetical protein